MASAVLVVVSALGVSMSHAFLLWRLVRRLRPGGGSRARLVLGALGLRLLPATTLLGAIWWGNAEAALVSLAGLWLGRTAVLVGLRVGRG